MAAGFDLFLGITSFGNAKATPLVALTFNDIGGWCSW